MKDKDKKGLWKFLLGLLKIIFRIGSKLRRRNNTARVDCREA